MKNIYTILILTSFLSNCNNSDSKTIDKNNRLEHVSEPYKQDSLKDETKQKLKENICDFSEPDTSVSGIILRNSKSADEIIGIDNKVDNNEQYNFYSLMDAETLTLTQHPGDGKNQISVFSVSYSDKAYHGYKQLNVKSFQTEKGIKIGLRKKQLITKLGNCYSVADSTKNCIKLYYRIESPKDSKTKILEKNNMPIYYALYTFCDDRLKHYEFGFEYP